MGRQEMIEGLLLTPETRIAHPKGEILHAIKRSSAGFVGFGEAYFSMVRAMETKGWKCHRSATMNLLVPIGKVRFVVFDERTVSESTGVFNEYILGEDNYSRLTVPPGLWVAFRGLGVQDSMLINISNEEHDPKEADNVDLDKIAFEWDI
jgi:dTDP-4-dehydrorhamnose 3,5-epimerase